MNSTFVGYEELSRSRRVLSILDLLNSSYPMKAEFINCYILCQYTFNSSYTFTSIHFFSCQWLLEIDSGFHCRGLLMPLVFKSCCHVLKIIFMWYCWGIG